MVRKAFKRRHNNRKGLIQSGDMVRTESGIATQSNPVIHCCHSLLGSLLCQPDIKGYPIPSYMLFSSQSAHSFLNKGLFNQPLAGV